MVEVIDDWVLGAFVGREDSRFLFEDRSDRIYGLSLRWAPSPRTELDLRVEQRFFGKAGSLNLRHRMPMMSFVLHVAREPQTSLRRWVCWRRAPTCDAPRRHPDDARARG